VCHDLAVTWIEPVTLEGTYVRLEPATLDRVDDAWRAGDHAEIWRYSPFAMQTRDDMVARIEYVNASGVGFHTVDRASGEVVGGTAFLAPDEANRSLEIGATWITPSRQRSVVNTEAKLLQLTYAFESLGCERVFLKTDSRNDRSRAALARIGATEEGTLRRHMLLHDGTWRDSVYFSVIRPEWPAVKERLTRLRDR
jgi:RimJ/RimL family protein N-acetyltransferase